MPVRASQDCPCAGEARRGLQDTTAEPVLSRTPGTRGHLVLPPILLHQHHPQVVCLPRAAWAELRKNTDKKTWQLKVERALLCSSAWAPWVMPLRSPGLARLYAAAKNETNAKHEVSRTQELGGEEATENKVAVSPLQLHSTARTHRLLQCPDNQPVSKKFKSAPRTSWKRSWLRLSQVSLLRRRDLHDTSVRAF